MPGDCRGICAPFSDKSRPVVCSGRCGAWKDQRTWIISGLYLWISRALLLLPQPSSAVISHTRSRTKRSGITCLIRQMRKCYWYSDRSSPQKKEIQLLSLSFLRRTWSSRQSHQCWYVVLREPSASAFGRFSLYLLCVLNSSWLCTRLLLGAPSVAIDGQIIP